MTVAGEKNVAQKSSTQYPTDDRSAEISETTRHNLSRNVQIAFTCFQLLSERDTQHRPSRTGFTCRRQCLASPFEALGVLQILLLQHSPSCSGDSKRLSEHRVTKNLGTPQASWVATCS